MIGFIRDARIMLKVTTLDQLRKKHRKIRGALKAFGVDVTEKTVTTPVQARVEENRWIFECACGAGVAATPTWPEARCMGDDCGRVYPNVEYPAHLAELTAVLVTMPTRERYWYPGETVADLAKTTPAEMEARSRQYFADLPERVAARSET